MFCRNLFFRFGQSGFLCIDNILIFIKNVQLKYRFKTILCVFKTNCGSHCHSITITLGAPEVIDCSGNGYMMIS